VKCRTAPRNFRNELLGFHKRRRISWLAISFSRSAPWNSLVNNRSCRNFSILGEIFLAASLRCHLLLVSLITRWGSSHASQSGVWMVHSLGHLLKRICLLPNWKDEFYEVAIVGFFHSNFKYLSATVTIYEKQWHLLHFMSLWPCYCWVYFTFILNIYPSSSSSLFLMPFSGVGFFFFFYLWIL